MRALLPALRIRGLGVRMKSKGLVYQHSPAITGGCFYFIASLLAFSPEIRILTRYEYHTKRGNKGPKE
ncbi:MAG: hypothetical protein UW27_C0002G0062 [Parcubacteria group bacterium GW2011_GWA1_44_13]|uniref:Uncharacterized protein n=1 Tax=Candidatus Nomurabacteria bacterium GW2011_GWB1_44_12 TaxID=1618748 RepID=A0A837I7L6_9BACT|nr:MAG: hypothetical protein UW17_C0014G0005 [Candidatus Nomurabacteria bacterium GW2011_GWD1_44_10]KKT37118.1 MAG: hypothetical protein UW25_C0002G0064 [Candidatus Nomurabacteria bacterium GW2011_GWB1_44_12]KKT38412.1 MAG: hypothetical protein UW27_C0002G0062 [Parcubacteria group bacterium GW2011_GWA1_44_13]KKT60760.1 MAG: hypothetical protein UW54_C0004G0022 [Parcubacteria group bacterium GW2011_GWC1_44_26]